MLHLAALLQISFGDYKDPHVAAVSASWSLARGPGVWMACTALLIPPLHSPALFPPPASSQHNATVNAKNEANGMGKGPGNNFSRPEGQNVGNFLGDRPSSKVHAPPGGGSQIIFG